MISFHTFFHVHYYNFVSSITLLLFNSPTFVTNFSTIPSHYYLFFFAVRQFLFNFFSLCIFTLNIFNTDILGLLTYFVGIYWFFFCFIFFFPTTTTVTNTYSYEYIFIQFEYFLSTPKDMQSRSRKSLNFQLKTFNSPDQFERRFITEYKLSKI